MLLMNRFRQLGLLLLLLSIGVYSLAGPALAKHSKTRHTTKITSSKATKSTVSTKTTAKVSTTSTPIVPTAHVTVDFSVNSPQKNMSGFLHGLVGGNPTDSLLSPLKPGWWRIAADDIGTYNRAVRLGAQPIIVLSDAYGYPQDNWQGNGAPWANNWVNWENTVRQLARQYKGIPVYWDIWNEPDVASWNTAQFWNGTQQQYFETYKRAYNILRQELGPNAMIGGPSYANYDPVAITAFLNYCNQNNLQVNFMSWHELADVDFSIPLVAQHIGTMRALAGSMPNLRMQKILINESVGPKITYYPGDILGTLYYLEKGGADGADKACWNDSKGTNNCFNGSVDGILNNAKTVPAPRASWWAYKTYADGLSSRVSTTTDNLNLVVMASKVPGQVLLGYIGSSTTPTNVSLNLRNLGFIGQKGASVKVNIGKVPNSGEATVASLVPVSATTVPVNSGSSTITIQGMNPHEEYVVYLTP